MIYEDEEVQDRFDHLLSSSDGNRKHIPLGNQPLCHTTAQSEWTEVPVSTVEDICVMCLEMLYELEHGERPPEEEKLEHIPDADEIDW